MSAVPLGPMTNRGSCKVNRAQKIEVCHSTMSASRPVKRTAIYDRFVSMSWMESTLGSISIDEHTLMNATTRADKTSSVQTGREWITSDQRRSKRILCAIVGIQPLKDRTLFSEASSVSGTVLDPLKVSKIEGRGGVIQFGGSPSLSKPDISKRRGWMNKTIHCRDALMDKRRWRALGSTSTLPVCVARRNDIEVTV